MKYTFGASVVVVVLAAALALLLPAKGFLLDVNGLPTGFFGAGGASALSYSA